MSAGRRFYAYNLDHLSKTIYERQSMICVLQRRSYAHIDKRRSRSLQRAAALDGFCERHFVGVIQVAADRQTVCKAGYRNTERRQ